MAFRRRSSTRICPNHCRSAAFWFCKTLLRGLAWVRAAHVDSNERACGLRFCCFPARAHLDDEPKAFLTPRKHWEPLVLTTASNKKCFWNDHKWEPKAQIPGRRSGRRVIKGVNRSLALHLRTGERGARQGMGFRSQGLAFPTFG